MMSSTRNSSVSKGFLFNVVEIIIRRVFSSEYISTKDFLNELRSVRNIVKDFYVIADKERNFKISNVSSDDCAVKDAADLLNNLKVLRICLVNELIRIKHQGVTNSEFDEAIKVSCDIDFLTKRIYQIYCNKQVESILGSSVGYRLDDIDEYRSLQINIGYFLPYAACCLNSVKLASNLKDAASTLANLESMYNSVMDVVERLYNMNANTKNSDYEFIFHYSLNAVLCVGQWIENLMSDYGEGVISKNLTYNFVEDELIIHTLEQLHHSSIDIACSISQIVSDPVVDGKLKCYFASYNVFDWVTFVESSILRGLCNTLYRIAYNYVAYDSVNNLDDANRLFSMLSRFYFLTIETAVALRKLKVRPLDVKYMFQLIWSNGSSVIESAILRTSPKYGYNKGFIERLNTGSTEELVKTLVNFKNSLNEVLNSPSSMNIIERGQGSNQVENLIYELDEFTRLISKRTRK